jgi:ribonuclease P protein component
MQKGSRRHGRFVTLFLLPSERPKAAFVVPKRYGKAVLRNKQKRRLRELYRTWSGRTGTGKDLVIYLKPGRKKRQAPTAENRTRIADWAELKDDINVLWKTL